MKKLLFVFWISILFLTFLPLQTAYAGDVSNVEIGKTLIPTLSNKEANFCVDALKILDSQPDPAQYFKNPETATPTYRNDILSCAIQTGRIHMWMIPYYIVYVIQFLIGISGLVAILFLVIGGFQYILGGVTEAKDKGKKTIQMAITGLVIVLVAWAVVNLVQFLITM